MNTFFSMNNTLRNFLGPLYHSVKDIFLFPPKLYIASYKSFLFSAPIGSHLTLRRAFPTTLPP